MKLYKTMIFISLVLIVSSSCFSQTQKVDRESAMYDFKKQVDEILPAVVSLTGIQKNEPVAVNLLTRAELGSFFKKSLAIEYPDESLEKRGRCFAEMGLLPQKYDLANGLLELLEEQAGAIYDPRSKTLIGISDLPPEQRRGINDRMILSHELTHALQDRVIDIVQQSDLGIGNIDYEYALRAVLEGMASSVMLAYAQSLPYNKLPDLQSFWRSQLAQATGSTLDRSPQYLREYLMSPYAEGGAFIQAWQKVNPDRTLNDLLQKLPSSSEQVLHFEKYIAGDEPADVDLSGVRKKVPEDWKSFYTNTFGEFDLLRLFQVHTETETNADRLAAGWDGCQFEAYTNKKGGLMLIGASVWDSENDAHEFCDGFKTVLKEFRANDDYVIIQNKTHVNFVIGSTDRNLRLAILESLIATD